MSHEWPDDDALLALVKESGEHQRVWALVRGLSKHLLAERESHLLARVGGISVHRDPHTENLKKHQKIIEPKPEGYADKIQTLEAKIVKQKHQLAVIEECRAFEIQTERLLVEGLRNIADELYANPTNAAKTYLETYGERLGPRPQAAKG